MTRPPIRGLYAIADTDVISVQRLTEAVAQAIAGGARLVQYRNKTGPADERERLAQSLATVCRQHDVLYVVNDDADLAAAVGADGVHVGRDDAPIAKVRERLGPRRLVGVSCYNDLGLAVQAEAAGADYVAFGSFFPSPTKPQAVRADIDLLRRARSRLRVPVVAIGGITPENGARLVAAGADALAVITGVFAQSDIEAAARRYAQLFEQRTDETKHSPT
ncbi:thiamine-phosphate pyrophosphorylase [Sulfurifustis variabilis]|uniref:Thiamine-phosphate synthase n=1 Tax=Sulfurifustis variabilis TaxID=1675686 RepID=A0A1C7AG19_9GAMM|nr:thiamine phosphate synthase [Sulfurifustis variabilis]BAU50400.1 thiamine-phosphate pyrophosphorylase [Sulfurifustis variabilis]